mmetsp:Transcript_14767/g.13242  ORF Transcript_14767/g.13242 Transcript_14767/m.13242 type:complete len:186 (-) Transcript_14767:151-708(-)|eukprot:CAMPEP_0201585090 /NCGR_PEP_ID=MMETSP0190_2-20130828/118051_1 /ASSEMBLY_ACC=CAM_ASM_000263 /TAXON_ID=37353 /ORGANISM="Rosalina sp." /LENGTH=185 /DNA_ID=CAMNT_0048030329 /DNA_START=23 /DNA_END=580 /DNA_ORIENTATION=+
MAAFNTTLDGILETIGVSSNQTQLIVTEWFHNIDPSRPKHNAGINAGYVFLIAIAIIFVLGLIKTLLPQDMVKQSGNMLAINDIKKDHYIIKHDMSNNDDNKLKDKETIIYNKPTFVNQRYEYSLSSTDTSVSRSDLEFGTGTDTDNSSDDTDDNEDNNSETSIESTVSPSNGKLGTIMEEEEEQ